MLINPTLDHLHALDLSGMARALAEQLESPQHQALSFEERLGLLVDREAGDRANRRLEEQHSAHSCLHRQPTLASGWRRLPDIR